VGKPCSNHLFVKWLADSSKVMRPNWGLVKAESCTQEMGRCLTSPSLIEQL